MLLSKVPLEELMELVDLVCEKLSLASIPDSIKQSSIRPSHDASKGDFTLCLGHPLWKQWQSNIEQVKQIIVESGELRILKIESCAHEISPHWLLHIKLNRLGSVAGIFPFCLSAQSSPRNVNGSQVVNEKLAIVTFTPSPRDRSWDALRLQLYSAATVQLVNTWTSKGNECTSIEIINDPSEWCKEITSQEVSAHFATLCPHASVAHSPVERCVVDISPDLSMQPPLPMTKIEVKKECKLLYLSALLQQKIDCNIHKRVMVIVPSKSLANIQKALALASLPVPIQLAPVESVSCEYSIEEFSDHLKRILITQSIEDCDDSSDTDGCISMPRVDSKKLISLFNTCIRCNLLSVKCSSHLTLKHEKNRNYLFIQYNIARIAAIVKQYEQQVAPVRSNDINYSSLTSDEEWSLILHYLLPFSKLKMHYSKGNAVTLTPDKLICFASCLAKDFGCYYSKTRILIDNWQTCPLVRARFQLLTCVQSILIDIMSVIGVDPVLAM